MHAYGRYSYLHGMSIPDYQDASDGYIYRVRPFEQVLKMTMNADLEMVNSSLVGVFMGLDEQSHNIMIRDGAPCRRYKHVM